MTGSGDYTFSRLDHWNVWGHSRLWNPSLWPALRNAIEGHGAENRSHIIPLSVCTKDCSVEMFLKIYPPEDCFGQLKDLFRVSKAMRYWRECLSLASQGFRTPVVVAAGERRTFRWLKRAFVLTERVSAESLSRYFRARAAGGAPLLQARNKWIYIRELGRQIGRMHRLGFVHGDLNASNILVGFDDRGAVYYYIDHDRTRRYPQWFPQTRWKRNLVQLNRLWLPGISSRDRLRFFQAYVSGRCWNDDDRREQRLRRWLTRRKKTCVREREFRRSRSFDHRLLRIQL